MKCDFLTPPAHVITVDMDDCLAEPMRDYWQRFPNATVHADVFYLEWGHADCDEVLIVVSEEPYTVRRNSGALWQTDSTVITHREWVIGVYPKNDSTLVDRDKFSDNPIWMCHVQDERVAVGTLHFLIEVL